MAITNMNQKFLHGISDIYDAEHQFLEGQQEMLRNASDPKLQQMINTHIQQTQGHIRNLEQVFSALGQQPNREACAGAKGLVTEGQKLIKETNGAIRDLAIAGAADKVEHYEIASYRGLIAEANQIGQQAVVSLLQANLEQEEMTAQLIESSTPQLLQMAIQSGGSVSQSYPQSYTNQ